MPDHQEIEVLDFSGIILDSSCHLLAGTPRELTCTTTYLNILYPIKLLLFIIQVSFSQMIQQW